LYFLVDLALVGAENEQAYQETNMEYVKVSEREEEMHLDVDSRQHGDWVEKMKV
jgi:hypothetical protein